jgi:hypothetical protein
MSFFLFHLRNCLETHACFYYGYGVLIFNRMGLARIVSISSAACRVLYRHKSTPCFNANFVLLYVSCLDLSWQLIAHMVSLSLCTVQYILRIRIDIEECLLPNLIETVI